MCIVSINVPEEIIDFKISDDDKIFHMEVLKHTFK